MTGVTMAAVPLPHFLSGTWECLSAWCLLQSALQYVDTLLDYMSLEGCIWRCCSCRVNRNGGEQRKVVQMWHLTCVGKWWTHAEFCLENTEVYQGMDRRVTFKRVGGTDCELGWSGCGEGAMATFSLLEVLTVNWGGLAVGRVPWQPLACWWHWGSNCNCCQNGENLN